MAFKPPTPVTLVRCPEIRAGRLRSALASTGRLVLWGCICLGLARPGLTIAANCLPPPYGLLGWWTGDGSANDFLGANNGTLQGGATATGAGEVGQAFSLDGNAGYVQVPNASVLQPTNLTIEAWVNFSSLSSSGNATAGQQYIAFKQNSRSGDFEGFYLGKQRNGAGDYFVFDVTSSAGVPAEVDSAAMIQTGVWYHVAGVRGPDYVQLYVNGQLAAQTNVSFPQDYGSFPMFFGTSGQSYWDGKFAGRLDEVSLYNRALSASEILAIYNAGCVRQMQSAGRGRHHLPAGEPNGGRGWKRRL